MQRFSKHHLHVEEKKKMLKSVNSMSDRGEQGKGKRSSPKLHIGQRSSSTLQNEGIDVKNETESKEKSKKNKEHGKKDLKLHRSQNY